MITTNHARPRRAARLEELALVDGDDLDAPEGVDRLDDRAARGPRIRSGAIDALAAREPRGVADERTLGDGGARDAGCPHGRHSTS